MYDIDHYWEEFNEEGVANPPNAKNVWSLAAIQQSLADPDGDGVGVMSESEQRQGCEVTTDPARIQRLPNARNVPPTNRDES